jgi:hypothetical protein
MNHEQYELASAYLDGAMTPDERARVESDPELMGLVAVLDAVAVRVGDVQPPAHDVRERAIGAALDAARPADVVPLVPRSRMSRALSYAAAVLAVGVLGSMAVVGLRGSGNDDIATSRDDAELFSIETHATDDPADVGDTRAGDVEAVPEAFPSAEPGDEMADDHESAMSTMEAPADGAEPPDADSSDRDDAETDVVELDLLTDAEIAELVRLLLDEHTEAPADEQRDACPEVLDEIVADDSLVTLYAGQPVLVGISGDLARVVDPAECDVLVEVDREHTAR